MDLTQTGCRLRTGFIWLRIGTSGGDLDLYDAETVSSNPAKGMDVYSRLSIIIDAVQSTYWESVVK
jgi:hypothetical protein